MRRGDVVWVNLDPVVKPECNKERPAIIVSNDGANAAATRGGRGVVTVVPLTTNTATVYPFQVMIPSADTGLPSDSNAQAEQVRSVSSARVRKRVGYVPARAMSRLDQALRLHLML